jgi:molybdopterin-biosynthesis enzyme MoeA-like protein
MAHMPKGSLLIDNIVSRAPGFQVENVYCMAGMPSVMHAMFESVLPTLKKGIPFISCTITCDLMEGQIADRLALIQDKNQSVDIGSYPFYRTPPETGVSFVIRGQDEKAIESALIDIIAMVEAFNSTPHITRA